MNDLLPIIEIIRGSTHDGPGMRTTIFTKGCPLSCLWCQNPESIGSNLEPWYETGKCIGCMECIGSCNKTALSLGEQGIVINRDLCVGCGECASSCPAKAIMLTGTNWTMDGLIHEVQKDRHYYKEFGGGVTVSGGEPLLYANFIAEFFNRLRSKETHTALDTCGCLPTETFMKTAVCADAVLYDIKYIDESEHMKTTGCGNLLILNNLKTLAAYIKESLSKQGRKIQLWIRTPLIPGYTATVQNIKDISDYIMTHCMEVIERWELCSFNSASITKYIKLQKRWPFEGVSLMKQKEIDLLIKTAQINGFPPGKLAATGLIDIT